MSNMSAAAVVVFLYFLFVPYLLTSNDIIFSKVNDYITTFFFTDHYNEVLFHINILQLVGGTKIFEIDILLIDILSVPK